MIQALLFFIALTTFADSSMDSYRWYLNPEGQEIKIAIDDLHDETIIASPSMDWGRKSISHTTLKKDVIIAVIDGGIEIDHPELKNNLAYNDAECSKGNIIPPADSLDNDNNGYKGDCLGWDFVKNTNRPDDEEGHGTHVSGIIYSALQGLNFKILPLKTFAPNEGKETAKTELPLPTRLVKAFEYAISRNVDVIHLSVGWPKSYMTEALEEVIRKALKKGIAVVSAAGNSSQRASIYPCQTEGVICVGALRANKDVARFSNWGSQVDIFAPGEKILSTIPHTVAPKYISRMGYDYKNGTSQAAPFISAAMAVLRGQFPDDSLNSLYARLMLGADEEKNVKGLKGLFHIDRSLNGNPASFVYPMVKGMNSVLIKDQKFSLSIPVKNYWQTSGETSAKLTCEDAVIENSILKIPGLLQDEGFTLSFSGELKKSLNSLTCSLQIEQQSVSLKLKILHPLPAPVKKMTVAQSELLVAATRTGARSRFFTMNAIKGTTPGPFYYVMGEKNVTFYKEDRTLGTADLPKGCNFLRIWQIDYDKDGTNELMLEGLCDKTHLLYKFLDQNLKEIYPSVKYKPTLTIVNYEEFEVILDQKLPPRFRFVNVGFSIPSENPWEEEVTSKLPHYYELFPVKDGDSFKFNVRLLENPNAWMKPLGLRNRPQYQVLHLIDHKLLVKIGQKTAWIDTETQNAKWANIDDVFLYGSRRQDIIGSKESILQSFLTPYEYRGYLLSNVKLRFIQTDKFDPLIDILGTEKNDKGYKTIIRSFQKLMYLQYDHAGVLIERIETTVDRFDFLTAQDLISSVVNLNWNQDMMQIVDGTKVNTNSVDFLHDGKMKSFDIPVQCVTQNPVVVDGCPTLPLFCAKTRTEFEMKFIDLSFK